MSTPSRTRLPSCPRSPCAVSPPTGPPDAGSGPTVGPVSDGTFVYLGALPVPVNSSTDLMYAGHSCSRDPYPQSRHAIDGTKGRVELVSMSTLSASVGDTGLD